MYNYFKLQLSLLILLSLLCLTYQLNPVVIVPGTGGNQLEAKLDKPSTVHFFCKRKSDWYTIWLQIPQLFPGMLDCWKDNFKLVYDKTTDEMVNNVGVEIRVPDFGGTSSIEYLDPTLKNIDSAYFSNIIQKLVEKGYTRGKSVYGAPYDFRKGPKSNVQYLYDLQQLIERAYSENGNQKVVLMSHSMGGLWSLHFLNSVSKEWKEKYILLWIPIAPAYGGAINEFRVLGTGYNEGVVWVKGPQIRDSQRTYESNFWLLPNRKIYSKDQVFVQTPSKNYTAHDIDQFLTDVDYEDGKVYYHRTQNVTDELNAPQVPVYPIYGLKIDTPVQFIYKADNQWDEDPIVINGDGDGTISKQSLEYGQQWIYEQEQPVNSTIIEGKDHSSILKSQELIDRIFEIMGI